MLNFEYDQAFPLNLQTLSTEEQAGILVHDICYAGAQGDTVTAYLTQPTGAGPFPAVLYLHHLSGNRSRFLEEAVSLASLGIAGLLIDAPFARPEPWRRPHVETAESDPAIRTQTIFDLRCGIDLLLQEFSVDPTRLGYIGYSYGASEGAILAGVEKRIKAYAFMAGGPSLTAFLRKREASFRATMSAEDFQHYLYLMAPLDSILYIGHAAPAALLFQFGRQDRAVPPENALRLFNAASEPKSIRWYEAGHGLNTQARVDRERWICEQLGVNYHR